MIKVVNSFSFEKEKTCNSSAPMLFTCETDVGYEPYFVKYIMQPNEFDCLVYEIICKNLANHFGITTPEIALVNIIEDSFDASLLKKNTQYFRAGVTAFGSLNVSQEHIMLNKQETIADKTAFNLYKSPTDFIKIAFFDLHIDNRDRNEENFNIIITKTRPTELFAIDHFDCFSSRGKVGTFSPGIPININETIIRSPICVKAIEFLEFKLIKQTLDEYLYLCEPELLCSIVDDVFSYLPIDWKLTEDLNNRIKSFICDSNRLDDIYQQLLQTVQRFKSRTK